MRRVAVIGLDAAEPPIVDEFISSGLMPHLASFRERSATCRLMSEYTWRSGRVWETFLTGEADFPSAAVFDPQTYGTVQLGSRLKKPFYAKVPSLNVLAIDVPYMSLWYDVPGAQVIWGGHDTGYPRASRPAGLLKEIDASFGVHPAFHNDFQCAWYHEPSINTLTDALKRGSRKRVEVVEALLTRFPGWDLFMTVLSETHSAGEIFWHGVIPDHPLHRTATAPLARRRLMEVYREVDDALGRILRLLPEDVAFLVCSVHGMQANDYDIPSMTLLPELLYRAHFGKGLLTGANRLAWRLRGFRPIEPPPWQRWHNYMRERFDKSRLQCAANDILCALGRKGSGARPIEELNVPIDPEIDVPPEMIDEPRIDLKWQVPCWYKPHWPKMRAFALPVFYDGRVRVNLKGRERDGIVELKDYRTTCKWVEELLHECRNLRTGEPVVRKIERLRDADPLDPNGPDGDLVISWSPAIEAIEHPRLGVVGPFPYRRTGGHTANGFAYFSGPQIQSGDMGVQEALLLTPTVLSMLGHPPPESSRIPLD